MSDVMILFLAFFIAAALLGGMITATSLLGPKRKSTVKSEPFESGSTPTTDVPSHANIKFYMVAMLFIIFDVETVFLYPWAILYRQLGLFGLVEMGLFVFMLLFGYIYIWQKGGFDWS